MRFLLGILLFVLLHASLHAQEGQKEQSFFPFKVGSSWTYRVKNDKNDPLQATIKLTKTEIKVGLTWYSIEAEMEKVGKSEIPVPLSFRSTGLYLVVPPEAAKAKVEPYPLLKFPLKQGESWEIKSPQNEDDKIQVIVEGEAVIDVPAGQFKTVVLSLKGFGTIKSQHLRIWYAKDVGPVKAIYEGTFGTNGTLTAELIKTNLSRNSVVGIKLDPGYSTVEASSEFIDIDRGVTAKYRKSYTVEHEVSLELKALAGAEVGAKANVWLAEAKTSVRAELEASLKKTFKQQETIEREFSVDGNTYQKYKVIWYDRIRKGTITLFDGHQTLSVPFTFREGAELSVKGVKEK